MPVTRTHRYARLASLVLALVHGLVALTYGFLTPQRPNVSGNVSVVLYIESFGPVWLVAHALTATALGVGLLRRRASWLIFGHCLAAAITTGYGTAALSGALLSDPLQGSPSGLMILGLATSHWIGALMWREAAIVYGDRALTSKVKS